MYIEQVHASLEQMLAALTSSDEGQIQAAYPPLNAAVAAAWQAYEAGTIQLHMRGKAIPRVMLSYIMQDMPGQLADSANWPKIRRELKNMQNLMLTVGEPEENGSPSA
ncbi:MAG TPA: hypothetical protein VD886_06455 [Herpetosiphonaceae bacterium]|nr:hypothetical protein [Herpetosiphonaceae bacterium]